MNLVHSVAMVRASYDLSGSRERWLGRVVGLTADHLDRGLGIIAYEADGTRGYPPVVSNLHIAGAPPGLVDAAMDFMQHTEPRTSKSLYTDEHGGKVGLRNESTRGDPMAGHPVRTRHGVRDLFFIGGGAGAFCCVVTVPLAEPVRLGRRVRADWQALSAHFAGGYRLRRALVEGGGVASGPGVGEALVDCEGGCHHASAGMDARGGLELLRHVARHVDRTRGRSIDDAESARLWKAFLSERWAFVDGFEEGGRRYLVVRRSPCARDPRSLTARERAIAALLLEGRSSKYIAYELGLAFSTVSSHLHRIAVKLGAASRAEMVRELARSWHHLESDAER